MLAIEAAGRAAVGRSCVPVGAGVAWCLVEVMGMCCKADAVGHVL